jgi:hypothetical protein
MGMQSGDSVIAKTLMPETYWVVGHWPFSFGAQHQLSDVRSVSLWPGSVGGLMECMARQRVRTKSAA